MFATLVVLGGCLATAQAEGLTLSEPRLTYGVLGPARADVRMLPGDSLVAAFDIVGLTTDRSGKAVYRTETVLSDRQGKTLFRQPPRDQEATLALGGHRVPGFARVDIGLDSPAGDYTLKVTVTDRASNRSASLTQDFTVLPKGFGIVGLTTTADQAGELPAGLLGPGQSLWLHAAVVGFTMTQGGQPKVALALRVLDDKGQPTLEEPFTGALDRDTPAGVRALPLKFLLSLNRPGKFTVELTATDQASGRSATQKFPLTVSPAR
jgi:hypothetical protein